MAGRIVRLRGSRDGQEVRSLTAELVDGNLVISGQDLGPTVAGLLGGGEYEWVTTVSAENLPAAVVTLGGGPGDDVLDVVARYVGDRAHEVEARLREQSIPVTFWSRVGD